MLRSDAVSGLGMEGGLRSIADIPSGSDASVMGTNDDATVSKASCHKKGYIKDDFVQFFVRRPTKRSPVINRGYYARWAAMRKLLGQFMGSSTGGGDQERSTPVRKQVLSLGAGFDTTYFQLQSEGLAPDIYVEVDFPEVTRRKVATIAAQEKLQSQLPADAEVQKDKGVIHSSKYHVLPVDLRNLDQLESALQAAGFNYNVPTLILAECVLIYMEPKSSAGLVQWAGQRFSTAAFVVYEQIHPDDAFGRQMIRNLESRGCPLLGIWDTPTLEAKKERFLKGGWQRAEAVNMHDIYTRYIDMEDRRRIERLELFDEFEEWHIMQEHYCTCYGINDSNKTGYFDSFGFLLPDVFPSGA